jgi:hypothetical protein
MDGWTEGKVKSNGSNLSSLLFIRFTGCALTDCLWSVFYFTRLSMMRSSR